VLRRRQGIFAFWVNAHLRRQPLKYIGFDGKGKQVRDALNPRDLAALLRKQIRSDIGPISRPAQIGAHARAEVKTEVVNLVAVETHVPA
jgi:hypothetical protein